VGGALSFPFPIGRPRQPSRSSRCRSSTVTSAARNGSGDVPSVGGGYIASPHLGLVATVPVPARFRRSDYGIRGRAAFSCSGLAAGSLELDDMLSVGMMGTFPIRTRRLKQPGLLRGPFAYARSASSTTHLRGNVTTCCPFVHGASTRQILGPGWRPPPPHAAASSPSRLRASRSTARRTSAAPRHCRRERRRAPPRRSSIAPRCSSAPFKSPSATARAWRSVSRSTWWGRIHAQTYTLTAAFDIPNPYGY